jgi:diguanylate cyclase
LRPVQASGEIVVVAKDERSRQAFGQLPWSRRYDALLLDRLREMGAKRIVFNELFDKPLNVSGDRQFANALKRAHSKVWLSAYSEVDEISGRPVSFVPMANFEMSCCLVSSYVWYDSFGIINNAPYSVKIGGIERPSSATILANSNRRIGPMRPDAAIQIKSIPTISAYKILTNKVIVSEIRGKSIIVGRTSSNPLDKVRILGQGNVSGVYVQALAAETIRNGVAHELGWLPPFVGALLVGFLCISRSLHRERKRILFVGTAILFALILIGDRIGVHTELVPALVALSIFGLRDHLKRQLLAAISADPVSGLPSLTELTYIRKYDRCIVAALKVERFAMHMSELDLVGQRDFVRAIAARINIIFPDQVVHQGDEGLFVWLIPPERDYEPLSYIAQLTALFRLPIGGCKAAHDVGVAIGFGSNLNEPFAARLAVAIDRARISLFGTLVSVQ